MKRLLYLGFAFPPGVAALFPEAQPAGHYIETNLIESVRASFEVRSVGVSGVDVRRLALAKDASPGLPHELNLLDKPPEIWHRHRSLGRLKRAYRSWLAAGWKPDVIMVCNFSPIFNGFVRWVARHPARPKLVLYLADSMSLGAKMSLSKRLRYRLKPLVWPDHEILPCFDACVATSRATEHWFAPRGHPWLWLPNGVDAQRALPPEAGPGSGPVVFGYFGTLARHSGLPQLMEVLTATELATPLIIAGFGKEKEHIATQCRRDPRLRFHGAMTPDGCLRFAQGCDVLVNARPVVPGNDNNFPSKVFEYALSGRAILTSRQSGADAILGEEAYYFDEHDFERSLRAALGQIAAVPRPELRRRGAAIQARLLRNFGWERQGTVLANFLSELLEAKADRR
jgi:glycosyltransferase involved in cell wall biosynthesis